MSDNVKRMKLDGMNITLVRVSLDTLPIEFDQFHKDCKRNICKAYAAFMMGSSVMNDMARTTGIHKSIQRLNNIKEATKQLRTTSKEKVLQYVWQTATKQLYTPFKVKLLQYVWQWAPEQLEGARDVEWSYADNTFEIFILREEGYPVSLTPDVIIEF